jgi:hypothetical protein
MGIGRVVDVLDVLYPCVVCTERLEFLDEDVGPQENTKENNRDEQGHRFPERRLSHHREDKERKKQVEVLFHAERPDVGERLMDGIVDEQVFGEGKELP